MGVSAEDPRRDAGLGEDSDLVERMEALERRVQRNEAMLTAIARCDGFKADELRKLLAS